MNDIQKEKAAATRKQNRAAREAFRQEQAEAKRAARVALQRVLADTEATTTQILKAATLLMELSK